MKKIARMKKETQPRHGEIFLPDLDWRWRGLQLFSLPKINLEATKEKVEEALETYRLLLLSEPEEKLPKITQTFSIVPPSNTNQFHSSTEDSALTNVANEEFRQRYIETIQKAVNRLNNDERVIIVELYLGKDRKLDKEVYLKLNMSERTYYRVKAKAFYNLAIALRLEVYE